MSDKKSYEVVMNVFFLLGVVAVIYGARLIYAPLGWILAGAFMLLLSHVAYEASKKA